VGDFVGAIGQGVSGLVGGSLNALSVAFDSTVAVLQQMLPGPWFPIAIVVGIVVLALFFKRLF
jgi:hypothetical protein